jgi:hypothetical protein
LIESRFRSLHAGGDIRQMSCFLSHYILRIWPFLINEINANVKANTGTGEELVKKRKGSGYAEGKS